MENTKMTMEEFSSYIKDHIFDDASGNYEGVSAELQDVTKNNGMELHGLVIKDEASKIAPTIYLEGSYEKYKNGMDVGEIMADIRDVYDTHRSPQNLAVDFFTDFDQAKDRLAMKIVNYDKNKEMLENLPHFKYGDLAAIFQVQVDANEFGNAVITVRNEHMNMWGTNPTEMMEAAKANMEEKAPMNIRSMMDVMADMMGMSREDMEEMGADSMPMYVMTNETKINGAAAMIFTDKLQEFAESHDCNMFILPSSIHEVLLIPEDAGMDVESLKAMVSEVNANEVAPEEVLSDNVYFYDKDAKQLMIAETKEPLVLKEAGKEVVSKQKEMADRPKTIKDKLADGKAKVAEKSAEPKLPKDKSKGQEI